MTIGSHGPANGSGADVDALKAAAARGDWHLEALDALSDGQLLVDRDLRLVHLCPGARRLLGEHAEGAVGKSLSELFPEAGSQSWRSALEGSGRARLAERLPPDGRRLEAHAFRVPAGLIVYLRDMAALYADAESENPAVLHHSLRRQTTDEPLWDWDLVSGELQWSSGLEKTFGIPATEVEPTLAWWEARLHPDDRERVLATLDSAIESGAEAWTEEYRFRRGDDGYATVLDRGFVLRDAQGKPRRMLGSMVDITTRSRIEEALRRSEERYRRFFDEDLTADYVTTPDGVIVHCNPAFARIFGFETVHAARQVNVTSLYPSPELRAQLLATLREEGAIEGRELELRRHDGAPIHVIANIRGEFDAAGKLLETRGYLFDITAHKQLEEQLRQSQKMEAVGKLAGGVAHDFNNLLTAILGHAELLLMDQPEGSSVHEELVQIRGAARRAAALTRELLAFSRRQVLQPRLFELDAALGEMRASLSRVLDDTVRLELHLQAPGCQVLADPGQIEQVVLNLVLNARDAMPQGGTLHIETELRAFPPRDGEWRGPPVLEGSYVVLSVTDDGTGMDAEVRQRIFEPFFTTKEQGRGTGLGLSTVYGIVQQSGGWVQVDTRLGQGTRFEVFLPRAVTGEAGPEGGESERSGGTVLLVEDEPSVRTLARKILERDGFSVLEAGDGEEALRRLEEHPGVTDLVLTDVMMPRMSGIELAERLESSRPHLPVIFMSGYSEHTLAGHGALRDPLILVEKPFSPQTLLRRVRQALS